MIKNKFLLALMAAALVFTGSSSLAAEKVVKWKLAMTWPDGLAPFAWTVPMDCSPELVQSRPISHLLSELKAGTKIQN